MDAKAVAGVLFDGSVIALVAAAITVGLDVFGFLNLLVPGAFGLGAATAFAFAVVDAPEWQRVAGAAVVAAVAGLAFDRLAFDPLRRRNRQDLMMASSLACSLIAFGILSSAIDFRAAAMPHSLLANRFATVGHFTFSALQAGAVALSVIVCTALHIAFYKTRFGAGVRAAIENPGAALLMGVRLGLVPPVAMAAICSAAGIAGALFAMQGARLTEGLSAEALIAALAACAIAPFGAIAVAAALSFALALGESVIASRSHALPPDIAIALFLAIAIAAGLTLRFRRTARSEPQRAPA